MINFKRSRGWGYLMQSKPILIALGVLILLFAWSILGFWNKMQDTEKNRKITEDKIAALREQKQKLLSDINSLNTDRGKEKVFRENFGLAKDGEDMIVIVEDKNPPPPPPPPTATSIFFSFFKNLFK